jgi:fatty acid desaturase
MIVSSFNESEFLARFRTRKNERAMIDLTARLVLTGASLWVTWLTVSSDSLILTIPTLWLTGLIINFWGWAGIGHEFFHSTVFSSRRLNRFFFTFAAIITHSNPGFFTVTHPRHHRKTLSPVDPENQSTVRISSWQIPLLLSFNVFDFMKRLRILFLNSAGHVPNEFVTKFKLSSIEIRQIVFGARLILLVQSSVFLLLTLLGKISLAVIVLVAPHVNQFTTRCLELLQHKNCKIDSSSPFETTRTLLLPGFLSWLYSNMNFHTEHHLHQGIPYYNLPKASDELVANTGNEYRVSSINEMYGILFSR